MMNVEGEEVKVKVVPCCASVTSQTALSGSQIKPPVAGVHD